MSNRFRGLFNRLGGGLRRLFGCLRGSENISKVEGWSRGTLCSLLRRSSLWRRRFGRRRFGCFCSILRYWSGLRRHFGQFLIRFTRLGSCNFIRLFLDLSLFCQGGCLCFSGSFGRCNGLLFSFILHLCHFFRLLGLAGTLSLLDFLSPFFVCHARQSRRLGRRLLFLLFLLCFLLGRSFCLCLGFGVCLGLGSSGFGVCLGLGSSCSSVCFGLGSSGFSVCLGLGSVCFGLGSSCSSVCFGLGSMLQSAYLPRPWQHLQR